MMEAEIPQDVMRQWSYEIDPGRMTKTLKQMGLANPQFTMTARKIGAAIMPDIEKTLEREVVQNVEHWGSRGWWYHGTMTEEEWILLKLKYFT